MSARGRLRPGAWPRSRTLAAPRDFTWPGIDAVTAPHLRDCDRHLCRAWVPCRTVRDRPRRHAHLWLLVGCLVPLLAIAQAYRVPVEVDLGAPAYGYPRGDWEGRGVDHGSRRGEPSFDYAGPSDEAGWNAVGVAPRSGYAPYPGSDEPNDGDADGAGRRSPAYTGGGPRHEVQGGDRMGQGTEGFRFRGDKAVAEGRWRELPHAPGFRFRPLTPEELQRSTVGDGWRPIGRDDRRGAQGGEIRQRDEDTFGYQPDSWFGKYYGERP